MKKQIVTLFLIFFSIVAINAQRKDTTAIYLLNRLSNVMGSIQSFSVEVNTTYDVQANQLGLVKKSDNHIIKVKGATKLNILSKGDKGHKGYWFNNGELQYYSFDKNNYGIIKTPDSIMNMVQLVHKKYGIEFPSSDFWYPTLTNDLMVAFQDIYYLGMTAVNGKECFHIIASNENLSVQIWISNDDYYLPQKMVIVYLDELHAPQYEALYNNWKLNELFPEAIFNFVSPPRAREITIKKSK
jgi:hypothetical protein